ncbi:response regulator transcription factor [Caulobacter sp. X]|uniref:response regulator transcription factor n=1 Tax=Caulobacter sp. X TaxID=2048901 RepID=UPI0021011484|nr:LuxR C-terminal-related transcriptional regulator [Caulobacter sp. X]
MDDDLDLAQSLARLFGRHGLEAHAFADRAGLPSVHRGGDGGLCIVTDIMLCDDNGFDVAQSIRAWAPGAAVLFMTAWPHTADAVDAIRRHGGIDYLEKPIDEERLLRSVSEGLTWSRERIRAAQVVEKLSPREREVLRLVADGKSSKAIANDLGLSLKTVEDHRAAIRSKTGVHLLEDYVRLGKALQGRPGHVSLPLSREL